MSRSWPTRLGGAAVRTYMYAKEIGEMTLLATITNHAQGLATPALYRINVQIILSAIVNEPETFARRITCLRSYLGAFRSGDSEVTHPVS